MAEINYILTIKNETQDKVGAEVGGAGGLDNPNTPNEETQPSDLEKQALGMAKRLVSVGTIMHYANQEVAFRVNQVELRTGNKEAQERTNFIYSKVSPIASTFVSSLAMSGGNVAVAGLSTAYTTLMQLINSGVQILHEVQMQSLNQAKQDITQSYKSERATYSGSRYQNVSRE